MYTRKARILFLAQDPDLTRSVVEILQAQTSEWLEGRAGELEKDEAAAWGDWPDLVIALDRESCGLIQAGGRHTPVRCWKVPAGLEAVAYIEGQLSSMAGGMRMLQRLDEGDHS